MMGSNSISNGTTVFGIGIDEIVIFYCIKLAKGKENSIRALENLR